MMSLAPENTSNKKVEKIVDHNAGHKTMVFNVTLKKLYAIWKLVEWKR